MYYIKLRVYKPQWRLNKLVCRGWRTSFRFFIISRRHTTLIQTSRTYHLQRLNIVTILCRRRIFQRKYSLNRAITLADPLSDLGILRLLFISNLIILFLALSIYTFGVIFFFKGGGIGKIEEQVADTFTCLTPGLTFSSFRDENPK